MKTHLLFFSIALLLLVFACNPVSSGHRFKNISPRVKLMPQERVHNNHIRGLFLIDDETGWASGANGTILRMTDGQNWSLIKPRGYDHLDFRDIHGFDAQTALAMAAGEEGRIIRTIDGGATWTEVYTNLEEGIFLDGIDFDGKVGYCIGDPIQGRNLILRSSDKGITWNTVEGKTIGFAKQDEGSYAASGTTIVTIDGHSFAAYGGPSKTRVLHNEGLFQAWKSIDAPLKTGAGCGIFSMAFESKKRGVAVGGCYLDSLSMEGNCAITRNKGKSWEAITENPPKGYRSCVAYAQSLDAYITCGRSGIDISYDGGHNWSSLSKEGYYTCALADSTGWLMGRGGKIGKLTW